MKAKFWTRTGEDIWRVNERRVFEFKNLETGEVVSCQSVSEITGHGIVPVKMPKIKDTKKEKVTKKSRYKGVSPSGKKFKATSWEGVTNKHLGTFDSELEAAAAYESHKGNEKEAQRLLNEHYEGNPETTEFTDGKPNPAIRPTEQ